MGALVRASGSVADKPPGEGLTILYSHGNAEDLGLHLPFIDALARATGADVFSYEYVGYSLSRFANLSPDEDGCYRSIDAAWIYLTETLNIPANRIVVYGRSIGTGPSVDLSPLESAIRCALGYGSSLSMYPLDIFKNYEKIENVVCKAAIIHGTSDNVVPCKGGVALHDALQNPYEPCWLEGYGHNNMPYDRVFLYARCFLGELNKVRRNAEREQGKPVVELFQKAGSA
ncbi:palmitoyl-(protein) hydrolase [Aureococcus anophagefferens]|nr:palmitoyl-(protein) hydrolase [Aureococcus anophagefferens]